MAYNVVFVKAILLSTLVFIPLVLADDNEPCPSDKAQLNSWFDRNVQPLAARKGTLNATLEAAEANSTVIKIKADGSGDFKTINDAIKSIPDGNTRRVIISIGPGNYSEKIRIERTKPFITFIGDPANVPNLIYGGTSAQYGTVDSATLVVESDFFNAVYINFVNSATRPDGKTKGGQALAVRIGGDMASFYNCKLYGFQDTLCDDKGRHLFKDCYIEGTVDFIFGNGKSIYLNVEMHVIPGDMEAMVTAQARHNGGEDTGFSFVHCSITGTGHIAYLGRAWMPFAKTVFAFTEMSDVVQPVGWSSNRHPENENTVFFGEYSCTGAGAGLDTRAPFTKKLTEAEVKPFLSLGFIEASKWLLPPTKI